MKLTSHFTLEELPHSATAIRVGIDNSPSAAIIDRLSHLATDVLQPLREAWGKPIIISSGYRCPTLNKAVGGVANSQHLLGEAADIHTLGDIPANNQALFATAACLVRDGRIKVGQLIDEKGYNWIHISLPDHRHTGQILHLK